MRTFECTCGNQLFFGSTVCVKCSAKTGICPQCRRVVPLVPNTSDTARCGHADCGAWLRDCANSTQNGCNHCVLADSANTPTTCEYCSLTTVIPNLEEEDNREDWRRLELAKRRVLYSLDQLGLQFRQTDPGSGPPLTFQFKADGKQTVHTGHRNGCITINVREASDVEREKARVAFQEPKRTLICHFRHELGHYFWERLVKGRCEPGFRALFGDEQTPSYAEALKSYHANGPANNWLNSYVSAYATMHPWEDFAETFRTYLDMVSILDTAQHFGVAQCDWNDIDTMIRTYQRVGTIANEMNRDMGLLDVVPEVFGNPVIEKLRFIAQLPRSQRS